MDKKRLVLASNNKGKIREFKALFPDYDVVAYGDLGINIEPDETGKTFFENAYIKAKTISDLTGEAVIADDSGICVDYLNGAPGIYSARYSGEGDKKNNEKLLSVLADVPDDKRTANFTCALCLCKPDGTVIGTEGKTFGKIMYEVAGENGFGYDVLFYSTEINKCFGLATPEEKNAVSHRYRSIIKMKEFLK